MAALALLVTLAIPMGVWGQAPVGTTLWGETWTGGEANETPSAYGFEGTTVYGGATLTYAQSSTNTKLYEEALAGGESPELLLSKSNQTWTISNIPTGQATGMALTFKSNKTTFDVTSTTTGITISGSQKSWTIAATSSVTTFNLTIKNTSSSNARIDDIVLSVTTAGGDTPQPTTYTVTYDCNGGTSGCPQNVTGIEPNTQIQLADAPSKDGFDFDGWSDGNTTYGENEDYTVTGNVTFTAQWTENTTPTPGGETATLNIEAYADANNWVNGTKYATAIVSPVTFTAIGGGNTGKYYTSGEEWRFYQSENASITISVAEGYTLVSVIPTYNVSNNGVLKNSNSTIASGSTVAVSGTTVTFTVGNSGSATNGQVKFTNIDVVYVSNGGVIPPSITANNVEITYDTDADEIEYEINNAVDGGVLTAGTESDWLTLGEVGATVPFTCSVNEAGTERTATVTLTYTYNRATVTKDVTVTQAGNPNVTMTIAEVREQGTGNVVTIGTVTSFSVNNNNTTAYIQDASAAIVVYGNFTTSVGDEIRVSGTLSTYHGLLEITNPQVTVISQGNTVNPEVMTIADINASTNQGWYIRIENATVTEINDQNTTIAQGENTIVVRGISGVEYAVNNVISLNGNIGCYEVNQIANPQNVEVQAAPAVPSITFNPDVVNLDAAQQTVQIPFTYENIVVTNYQSFTVHYYDANGEEIQLPETPWYVLGVTGSNDEGYNLTGLVTANEGEARSAYMKVSALDAEENVVYSNLITINQAQYVVDYATLPFAYDGNGTGDLPNGFTVSGLGTYNSSPAMKFDGTGDYAILKFNERPGTLTFDIKGNTFSGGTFTVQTSEDGETYTDLKTYTELGDTQHESFTNLGENVRYIKWIYTEKVSGNVGLGNIALAEYTEPQQYTLTVEPFENLELITFVNDEMVLEGDGEITVTEGDEIMLSVVALEGYEMETLMVNGVNHVNDIAEDYTYTFVMPAEDVTISATAVEYVAPVSVTYSYTLANSIESGKQYIIVGWADGTPYAMGYDRGSNRHAVGISVTGNDNENAIVTIANTETNPHEFTITSLETAGFYSIQDATASGYLYAASRSNNHLKTEAELDENHNGEWEISFDAESGSASVVASQSENRNVMQFNNSSTLFACYATASQHPVYLYEKVEYPLDIIGYEAGSDGGYYLIASPVTVNPANVEGMTAGEYDLYSFDQAEADEWRNYKVNAFNLEPGKGYLYAKQATEPEEVFHFELTGTPYNGEPIRLSKSDNVDFPGWNLVGNPFGQTAYIDRDFYVMKSDGSEIIESETDEIAVMQGIFVIAANDGEELTFSTEAPTTTDGKIVMNVSNARRSVVDRATVRFGEGRTLPKFMFNPNSTKLYIDQNGEDFAVVRSIDENATPVSFHAAENGTYTLSINAENVEMEYLHLLDNMTGADVDLLATPSYTFEARTTDYANRFKLVYATTTDVNENNVEPFAFFNGSEWVINNEGEATLQVIDINGRMLSNETVNGNANVNINATSGIYMLRLVNGESVKTQKVVVK